MLQQQQQNLFSEVLGDFSKNYPLSMKDKSVQFTLRFSSSAQPLRTRAGANEPMGLWRSALTTGLPSPKKLNVQFGQTCYLKI
jgi:hypothetical protein